MAVQVLTEADFEKNVLNERDVVLVDFWREGCGPCRALLSELEALSGSDAAGRSDLHFYKANVDTEESLALKLRVMTAPTLFFFKDGEIRKKTIGFKSKKSILEAIESIEREE
jgi:thioredoxin 1